MSNGDMIVDVWFNSQEAQKGVLSVNSDSVIITLESGDFISSSNSTNILYSLPKDPRISQFRIRFSPVVATIHPYSAEIGQVIEDIFPPSSCVSHSGYCKRSKIMAYHREFENR
ncbi:MAG: hypothetical protein ACXACT_15660 [Candidatus Thorarchaeota archaeon]